MTTKTDPTPQFRVAIVGSGPSGFYALDALLKQDAHTVQVDMLDRLPVPYGLVRYGVAPDHQNIKAVIRQYEKMASNENFRFYGNVELGTDISIDDLRRHYHAVVMATGCESSNQLGLDGEDAIGSYSATEFVAWYNGHPDYRDRKFQLDHERVAVVGVGNVAMDVTRILVKDRDELFKSDIAPYSLDDLRACDVREVVLLGRRGPAQAAFSSKEIKEIGELDGVQIVIDPELLENIDEENLDRDAGKNIAYLKEQSVKEPAPDDKRVVLKFLASPVALETTAGAVSAVTIEKNELVEENGRVRPRGTGETETMPIGMIFRSIGYRGIPIEGIPFDDDWGTIPNDGGRVLEQRDGDRVPGLYAVGWIKRGPSGLVGSNKPDSAETIQVLLADAESGELPQPENTDDLADLLESKNIQAISFSDWKKLDALEIANGEKAGRVREKFTSVEDMLAALK